MDFILQSKYDHSINFSNDFLILEFYLDLALLLI